MSNVRGNSSQRAKLKKIVFADKFDENGELISRGDICYLCEEKIDLSLPPGLPGSPEKEHIVATSKGGAGTDPNNLLPSHRKCNQSKSALPVEVAKRNIMMKKEYSREW